MTPSAPDEVHLHTITEVAQMLRVSEPVVRSLIREYEESAGATGLRAVRLGPRVIRVLPEDINALLRRES